MKETVLYLWLIEFTRVACGPGTRLVVAETGEHVMDYVRRSHGAASIIRLERRGGVEIAQ